MAKKPKKPRDNPKNSQTAAAGAGAGAVAVAAGETAAVATAVLLLLLCFPGCRSINAPMNSASAAKKPL